MIKDFKIITLCGSTRFKADFLKEQKRLTLDGNIVISVGLFGHSGDDEVWSLGTKEMLDTMHLAKIDLADEIFVINTDCYIGESTKKEILYAIKTGKKVKFMINDNIDKILGEIVSENINFRMTKLDKEYARKYIKELQDKIDKLILDYELSVE
jgi:hypothetical protein